MWCSSSFSPAGAWLRLKIPRPSSLMLAIFCPLGESNVSVPLFSSFSELLPLMTKSSCHFCQDSTETSAKVISRSGNDTGPPRAGSLPARRCAIDLNPIGATLTVPWILAQAFEPRLDFEVNHPARVFLFRLLEPLERLIIIFQAHVDESDVVGRDVLLFR